MLQLQNGWLVFNWRRRRESDEYPRFSRVRAEFEKLLRAFREFVRAEGLGDLAPSLWEVTYVNHIDQGKEWSNPSEWTSILPGLLSGWPKSSEPVPVFAEGEWVRKLSTRAGHIRIHLSQGTRHQEGTDGIPTLVLQLTARGPIAGPDPWTELDRGLETGHMAALDSFVLLSSEKAHKAWGRRSS